LYAIFVPAFNLTVTKLFVLFDGTLSSNKFDTINKYKWSFGDGSSDDTTSGAIPNQFIVQLAVILCS